MITKEQLTKLFHWGNRTKFPLRKEGITSKYMGYDVFVSYAKYGNCLLYTSPSPRDRQKSRMPSSA